MKLGCCVNMLADEKNPTGSNWIPILKGSGYDYVELPLAQIMDLDGESFLALQKGLEASGIPCECCNNFFPAAIRLTGPQADRERMLAYAGRALERADRLGARIVVFGSSGAKNIPAGFDAREAYKQVVWALAQIGELARKRGMVIAIEPLNRTESNLICSVGEGAVLMEAVGHPHVRLLVDYYHFAVEEESPEELRRCAGKIVHTHFAQLAGRTIPHKIRPEHRAFYKILRDAGYRGRVSVEAFSKAPKEELRRFAGLFAAELAQ